MQHAKEEHEAFKCGFDYVSVEFRRSLEGREKCSLIYDPNIVLAIISPGENHPPDRWAFTDLHFLYFTGKTRICLWIAKGNTMLHNTICASVTDVFYDKVLTHNLLHGY